MVTEGNNKSINIKLHEGYAKRANIRERKAAISTLKIEKLRSTNNEGMLSWQVNANPEARAEYKFHR